MKLTAADIGYRIGDADILDAVDLHADDGDLVALVGANGSGKSTLLRLLYRALDHQRGVAWLDADSLFELPRRQAACLLGAVPQEQPTDFELTVDDLVHLGRLPHQRMGSGTTVEDAAAVARAMAATGIAHLAGRHLDQLSGGERQRAVVARALAQAPEVLLLDEPTNHLDVHYQHDLLGLLRRVGLTTVVALHDLNLAAAYADRVVVLHAGSVLATGPVADVLVPEVVAAAFGIGSCLVEHPHTGRPQLLFHPTRPKETP